MALLELPPEILIQIYCNLRHVHEAINLAQTCTAANELFCRPLSRQHILQSIISVTDGANRISTMNLSGNILHQSWESSDIDIFLVLRKLYCSLILKNPLHDGTFSSASLSNFLEQFDDLKSNSLVDTVLIKSARYQRKLMENTNLTTIDRKTIIARTLHCYVMVSKIANAFCRKCEEQQDENDMEEFCSRLLGESRSDPIVDAKSISFPFRTILEDLEIMIRQGTPKDWPIILTVLCILFWMTSEFQRDEHGDMQNFLFDLDYPPDALEAPLFALSRMFYIQMTGNHPFRSSWEYKAYAKLVQGDSLATTQFEMLNKSWYIASELINSLFLLVSSSFLDHKLTMNGPNHLFYSMCRELRN